MMCQANADRFLAEQPRFFKGSYDQFLAFGGPCVYFHDQCLRAGKEAFLSQRHLEMLYATLTAWGMHRMGGSEATRTKLTSWDRFSTSIADCADDLEQFRSHSLTDMTEKGYSEAILRLRPFYARLELSVSDATIVANSKALYHFFPDFVPPIDRQYTIRFFQQPPERWLNAKGRFRLVTLPKGLEAQFRLFHETCLDIKRLADKVDARLLEEERQQHGVSAPKAIDNAVVNYVRILRIELIGARQSRA